RGVDAHDPQAAEIPLAGAAVAIGVFGGAIHRGLGRADRILAAAVKAFGGLQDLLAAGVFRRAGGNSGHGTLLKKLASLCRAPPQRLYGMNFFTILASCGASVSVPRFCCTCLGVRLIMP